MAEHETRDTRHERISIVLPCFNEESNIGRIYSELTKIMAEACPDYELIFVDDGSNDNSLLAMIELQRHDKRIKIIEFSKNFGHQAALCAGMDHASGDAVITMDADLQHPPSLIPKMIEKWKKGYEIVYTVRQDNSETAAFKKITSYFFYKLINTLGKTELPENCADFRLLDKKVVTQLTSLKERVKFLRGLVHWVGFRQCALHYPAERRHSGASKYNVRKMTKFAIDGITSFSSFPLHIATYFGFFVSTISFIYAIYAIYIKIITKTAVAGWTSIMTVILFLGGIQLFSLGIIGEYINRIYLETKCRPAYIIRNLHSEKTQN